LVLSTTPALTVVLMANGERGVDEWPSMPSIGRASTPRNETMASTSGGRRSRFDRRRSYLAPNLLQLFWRHGDGFSEARSLTTPLLVDNEIRDYVLPLPADAEGPLRLDLGNRPGCVEIHRIDLGASRDQAVDGEILGRWVAEPYDGEVIQTGGVIRLSGGPTCRYVCTDNDPHLVLDGVPERHDARPWFVRVTLRASTGVLGILAEEIRELEGERARLEGELRGA
jgi:hypothetical protein